MGLGYATNWNNTMLRDPRAYSDIMDSDPNTNSYMVSSHRQSMRPISTNRGTESCAAVRRCTVANRDLCIICMVGVTARRHDRCFMSMPSLPLFRQFRADLVIEGTRRLLPRDAGAVHAAERGILLGAQFLNSHQLSNQIPSHEKSIACHICYS